MENSQITRFTYAGEELSFNWGDDPALKDMLQFPDVIRREIIVNKLQELDQAGLLGESNYRLPPEVLRKKCKQAASEAQQEDEVTTKLRNKNKK